MTTTAKRSAVKALVNVMLSRSIVTDADLIVSRARTKSGQSIVD